jgi:hypothetical protein
MQRTVSTSNATDATFNSFLRITFFIITIAPIKPANKMKCFVVFVLVIAIGLTGNNGVNGWPTTSAEQSLLAKAQDRMADDIHHLHLRMNELQQTLSRIQVTNTANDALQQRVKELETAKESLDEVT